MAHTKTAKPLTSMAGRRIHQEDDGGAPYAISSRNPPMYRRQSVKALGKFHRDIDRCGARIRHLIELVGKPLLAPEPRSMHIRDVMSGDGP